VLAAFGLVALAARSLLEGELSSSERITLTDFQLRLLRSLDCTALIGGQAMDLKLTRNAALRARFEVAELKTVPLFELAVRAGSLFADIDDAQRASLNCLGREFGLAFQLTDDLLDQDVIGVCSLDEKLLRMGDLLSAFGPRSSHVSELLEYLNARVPAVQAS
jgi:geranylgeranyl pyrophosphate synthase